MNLYVFRYDVYLRYMIASLLLFNGLYRLTNVKHTVRPGNGSLPFSRIANPWKPFSKHFASQLAISDTPWVNFLVLKIPEFCGRRWYFNRGWNSRRNSHWSSPNFLSLSTFQDKFAYCLTILPPNNTTKIKEIQYLLDYKIQIMIDSLKFQFTRPREDYSPYRASFWCLVSYPWSACLTEINLFLIDPFLHSENISSGSNRRSTAIWKLIITISIFLDHANRRITLITSFLLALFLLEHCFNCFLNRRIRRDVKCIILLVE